MYMFTYIYHCHVEINEIENMALLILLQTYIYVFKLTPCDSQRETTLTNPVLSLTTVIGRIPLKFMAVLLTP